MSSFPLAQTGTKKRIASENACSKAYEKLMDPNICSGAKELIGLGKAGVLSKGGIDEEIRQAIFYAAFWLPRRFRSRHCEVQF